MIIGFVGTPGSGKSYEAVKKILDNLKSGRVVYTNIDGLQIPECQECIKQYAGLDDYQLDTQLFHLTDTEMQFFWEKTQSGSLVVIDEVHKLFSNRDWNSDVNKRFTEWASTHRHEGYDVVLITQDIEKIDKHARSLIEWTYFFRKINYFGNLVQKKYLCYSYAGDDHNGKPLDQSRRAYNPKIFNCYKSYSNAIAKEVSFMKHTNILRHPVFFAIPIMLVIFGYFFSKSSFIHGQLVTIPKAKVESKVAATAPTSAPPSSASTTPSSPVPVSFKPAESISINAKHKDSATKKDKDEPDPDHDTIIEYRLPDGRSKFTNRGLIPPGGLFVRQL